MTRRSLAERLVLAVPFAWMALLFLAPLAIVVKISLSRSVIAMPPYEPAFDLSLGWADALDKLGPEVGIERMRDVIAAMTEDVLREGAGEIIDSREARGAIGKKTAEVFKARLQAALHASA